MSAYTNSWHPGETAVQCAMGWNRQMQGVYMHFSYEIPEQHQIFYGELAYIAITTLDEQRRPWGSLLTSRTGRPGFIRVPNESRIKISADVWEGDPIRKTAAEGGLAAGLGIMFANRRRNKFAGRLGVVQRGKDQLELAIDVDEALGNCPKYINVRDLRPQLSTTPKVVYEEWNMAPSISLPDDIVSFIRAADTVFLGTTYVPAPGDDLKYPPHAGMNQRGGRPGFIRVRADKRTIVLPDYSGNRFMQSLGNIDQTPLASLTFVDFLSGNVLYLTGSARNHLGSDARAIMLQVRALTMVEVTGYVLVTNAFPFRQVPGTEAIRSPYSPPVRFLLEEPEGAQTVATETTLRLKKMRLHTPAVATFTFAADPPVVIVPGQAAIIDTSTLGVGKHEYQHMAQRGQETNLNDDGVRTWTVSSAHKFPAPEFSIVMQQKPGGAVTTRLLNIARACAELKPELCEDSTPLSLTLPLVGIAGAFTLASIKAPSRLLFIAGGIGITPFLSMLGALAVRTSEGDENCDVALVVSTKEPELIIQLVMDALDLGRMEKISLELHIFSTGSPHTPPVTIPTGFSMHIHQGRLTGESYPILDTTERDIYVCGPRLFEDTVIGFLTTTTGVRATAIHRENFDY
ncbi:hypothetical protein PUNSTDRAFT_114962 [Punctularia strigosozonata HHB-11173 SS5]|uniref:uncharacterized protein n=1 Tax=Punctularia strigosozonata (strain HHB-11173) TaxID=741275 RepID=UPI0004416A1B|nr:uncharacterized protein PUNSTDRAFT_114962 [Punctularia strigosozonata HHB-11173 SS5]EIN06374.1 hypothetical protein PUNSTDRAFT_114962 [Punctularia strigosozonata HHB-11173 SS5]